MRAYLISIALTLVLAAGIGGYQYQRLSGLSAQREPPPVTIAAAEASTASWDEFLDAVGTIEAVRGVSLSTETSGEIIALEFDSGQRVAAGQLLLVLNDRVEQAARENQRAALELARILYERDLRLIGQKSISQAQFDRSRADLAQATAQLAETEARIRAKRMHAPFAGTLGIRRVTLGDYVEPGTVIASLQDGSELDVDFAVPARHAPELHPGQTVRVTVDAWPQREFVAELSALDTAVDPATRNLQLRARLRDTDGLLPGMFARLRLDLGRTRTVVTVPETAITYSLQGDTVFVIEPMAGGGLTASARIVKVGDTREGRTAILRGVEAGEQVVSAGQNKLYRGVRVLVDDGRGT